MTPAQRIIMLWRPAPAATPGTSTFNPADKTANTALSPGNLGIGTTATGFNGARGTLSKSTSGKYVYEFLPAVSGNFYIGINKASGNVAFPGLADNDGASWYTDGRFFRNSGASQTTGWYLPSTTNPNMIAFDVASQNVWVLRPGGLWNNSGAADPAAGTGGFSIAGTAGPFFIDVGIDSAAGNVGVLNTGGSAFFNPVPSGFVAWG